jgi:cytochrome c oxidase assembly protein subunit 11
MNAQNRLGLKLGFGALALVFTTIVIIPPFYDWFCRVTGFGGTTNVADGPSPEVLEDVVRVRFDATTAEGMPWEFRPAQPYMDIRIGETGLAFYTVHNPTDRAVAGTATYNVTPEGAGFYFAKIACFCFEMQVLQPGETVDMPVSFYVDPAMMGDVEGRHIREITLSYTFFETDLPDEQSALAGDVPAPAVQR